MNKMKKGNILMENVIFIILIIVFISILFVFVTRQGSNQSVLEKQLAKQIALVIDEAEPGTQVQIRVEDEFNKYPGGKIQVDNNVVNVNFGSGAGYSYGYFNKVNVESNILDLNSDGFKGRYLTLIIK
ncbi:hypothetical protein AUJ84_00925 [Candidatus Pacearchaeota archaeon CG1_02_32_132]|nr:MAG: hypothetical protein AUJ84_00925 [Candidatus Pacearchaeota archaeon CG1_02_32_132]